MILKLILVDKHKGGLVGKAIDEKIAKEFSQGKYGFYNEDRRADLEINSFKED